MKIVWKIAQVLLSLFLIYVGVQHFLKPDFYEPFVPVFLPAKTMIVYLSGVVEIAFGVLMFIPKYTRQAAKGVLILMLIFLPIHIWDVFSDTPNHRKPPCCFDTFATSVCIYCLGICSQLLWGKPPKQLA